MQIPNSSPQRRLANDTPSQNANSQSTGGNQPSGPGDIKKYIQVGQNPAFLIPPGGLNCDILMIGGGAGAHRGGGGAGACIVAINQTLPPGNCVVSVGIGGGEYTNGGDSSISVGGITRYLAKGGGSSGAVNANGKDGGCGGGAGVLNGSTTNYDGGNPVATNIVNGISSIGPSETSTYAVYGNRGGHQRSTTGKSPSGYYAYPGGGGGIGSPGQDNNDSNPKAGKGGDGLNAATINGIIYNFKQYFGVDGFNGNGYIGGGGGGDNGTAKNTGANGLTGSNKYSNDAILQDNTGSGGNGAFGKGSSGIVIIRVRT